MKQSTGPLSRFTVLDLTRVRSGPTAVRQFADWGANVIKIEAPENIDASKGMGGVRDGPDYQNIHRNKRGITINMKKSDGVSLFLRLVEKADVVVENFRPGVLNRLGIDYKILKTTNPEIVLTSISGFGQDGPYKDYKGGEIIEYAMSMVMSISGIEGEAPLKHGGFQAQYQGGLFGAAATSMALFAQSNTGIGEHVDVSIVECLASTMMATQTIYPFVGATQARRRSEGDAFSNPMPCKDGWIIVQAGGGATWEDLANFFDAPELLEPRFAEPGQRSDNGVEMDEIIINSIKDRGKWELFTKAADARMLFGLVQTPSELVDCPQLKSRDFFREVHHPVMGDMIVPAELFKLSETPYQLHKSSPTLGQHNHEIYVEGLGYSTEEFCQLRQLNVI